MLPTLRRSLFSALRSRLGRPSSLLSLFPTTSLRFRLQPADGATISTASTMDTGLELGKSFVLVVRLIFVLM